MILIGQATGIVATGGIVGAILVTYEVCDTTVFVLTTADELLEAADESHRKWLEQRMRENDLVERGDLWDKMDDILGDDEFFCASSIRRASKRDCDDK